MESRQLWGISPIYGKIGARRILPLINAMAYLNNRDNIQKIKTIM